MIDLIQQRRHDRHIRNLILCADGRDEHSRRCMAEQAQGELPGIATPAALSWRIHGMKRRDRLRHVCRIAHDLAVAKYELPASVPGHVLIVGH
jgi:hypothetical protein